MNDDVAFNDDLSYLYTLGSAIIEHAATRLPQEALQVPMIYNQLLLEGHLT